MIERFPVIFDHFNFLKKLFVCLFFKSDQKKKKKSFDESKWSYKKKKTHFGCSHFAVKIDRPKETTEKVCASFGETSQEELALCFMFIVVFVYPLLN